MYQPNTIPAGSSGGFSIVNSPACITGAVACVSGDCWVTFKSAIDPGLAGTGINTAVTDPSAAPSSGVVVGAAHLYEGDVLPFGSDPASSDAPRDAVLQIDIYCNDAEVVIQQH